jgi:hypothetical protein
MSCLAGIPRKRLGTGLIARFSRQRHSVEVGVRAWVRVTKQGASRVWRVGVSDNSILFSSVGYARVESHLHIRSFRLALDERSVLQVEGDFEGPPYHDAVWGASYADLKCLIYRGYGTRDDPFSISKVKFQVLSHPLNRTWARLANYASPPDLTFSFFNFFSVFSAGMAQCACECVRCAASLVLLSIQSAEICRIFVRRTWPIGPSQVLPQPIPALH